MTYQAWPADAELSAEGGRLHAAVADAAAVMLQREVSPHLRLARLARLARLRADHTSYLPATHPYAPRPPHIYTQGAAARQRGGHTYICICHYYYYYYK